MALLTPRRSSRMLVPWPDVRSFENRLERMMEDVWPGHAVSEAIGWTPAVELVEQDERFVLTAELPGLRKENVDIEIEDDVLTFRGEKKSEREEKDGKRHVWERSYGAFERSFTLPRSVDAGKVTAEFMDGVLTVVLPKTREAKGRKIEIAAK